MRASRAFVLVGGLGWAERCQELPVAEEAPGLWRVAPVGRRSGGLPPEQDGATGTAPRRQRQRRGGAERGRGGLGAGVRGGLEVAGGEGGAEEEVRRGVHAGAEGLWRGPAEGGDHVRDPRAVVQAAAGAADGLKDADGLPGDVVVVASEAEGLGLQRRGVRAVVEAPQQRAHGDVLRVRAAVGGAFVARASQQVGPWGGLHVGLRELGVAVGAGGVGPHGEGEEHGPAFAEVLFAEAVAPPVRAPHPVARVVPVLVRDDGGGDPARGVELDLGPAQAAGVEGLEPEAAALAQRHAGGREREREAAAVDRERGLAAHRGPPRRHAHLAREGPAQASGVHPARGVRRAGGGIAGGPHRDPRAERERAPGLWRRARPRARRPHARGRGRRAQPERGPRREPDGDRIGEGERREGVVPPEVGGGGEGEAALLVGLHGRRERLPPTARRPPCEHHAEPEAADA